jgi:hypothetical protein
MLNVRKEENFEREANVYMIIATARPAPGKVPVNVDKGVTDWEKPTSPRFPPLLLQLTITWTILSGALFNVFRFTAVDVRLCGQVAR